MSFDPITSQGLVSAFTTALAAGDTVMSSRGLDSETAHAFSQSVTATAHNAERGRRAVYQGPERSRPERRVAEPWSFTALAAADSSCHRMRVWIQPRRPPGDISRD